VACPLKKLKKRDIYIYWFLYAECESEHEIELLDGRGDVRPRNYDKHVN
jgi:hypothetical protein